MKKKKQMLELLVTLGLGDTLEDEHRALAARLLRNAADRIERGDDLGGFHMSEDDSYEGGFALFGETKQ